MLIKGAAGRVSAAECISVALVTDARQSFVKTIMKLRDSEPKWNSFGKTTTITPLLLSEWQFIFDKF